MISNIKYQNNQWGKLNRCHYCQISKFWCSKCPTFVGSFLGQSEYLSKISFWPNHKKKPFLYVHKKLQRNPSSIFLTLWIWKFGIFDKHPQGCDEVKNSMGLLKRPRPTAWTKKCPIWGNHQVLLGCRVLLDSVKTSRCKETKPWKITEQTKYTL